MSRIPDCDFMENESDEMQREMSRLENENKTLREENDALREENRKLIEQVQALSALGSQPCHNQPRERGQLEHEFIERKHW